MLNVLISSRTRIKLLLRFFLNPGTTAYLRGLADEFDESTNAIRVELNKFEKAGMILSENQGNKKVYKANADYALLRDIHSILLKHIGLDKIVTLIIKELGQVDEVYLCGDYACGKDTGIIELAFIGSVDENYLQKLIIRAQKLISRQVTYRIYEPVLWDSSPVSNMPTLLLWQKN
jgi:DNA-binding transcriptional ArsR family regulator